MTPTVLIVDDHPSFRRTARAVLEADGLAVVGEAAGADEALAATAALRPDVVLLDVCLPDGDGFAVARAIGQSHPRVAVVLTSSRDEDDYGLAVARCGARGFVPKDDLSGASLAAAAPGGVAEAA